MAAAVYAMLPLPLPLAVTVSQLAFDDAVHGQAELLMVSATALELPVEGALALDAPSDAVQPEACEIEKVEPPATMVPERAGPLLAETANATLPEPVPEAVTPVMNPSGEPAVQVHVGLLIVIVNDELLPVAGAASELGDKLAVQPLACVTLKVLPAMVSEPVRAAPVLAVKS